MEPAALSSKSLPQRNGSMWRSLTLQRVVTCLAGLLILKVTGSVVLNYRQYLPPNFDSDFLQGRESYFWGSYQWAFYTHIAAGPLSLILGMLLISERFRLSFPKWHRYLGRVQVPVVLFLVAPSGLWMAYRAEAGAVAGLGFAALAVITGTTVALGWRLAVKRRFAEHRRWMQRCYLLLCSTVVLRLTAGLATVLDIDAAWLDALSAWASWLVPLAVFECLSPSSAWGRTVRSSAARLLAQTPLSRTSCRAAANRYASRPCPASSDRPSGAPAHSASGSET